MLRNRSCSRAFSLAARLCCNEDVAWSSGTPAAGHLLQLLHQTHCWTNTTQSAGLSTTLHCHSNAVQQHHTQSQASAVHYHWPAARVSHERGTCRMYTCSSTNSDISRSSSGDTPQNAATGRPHDLALVFTCAKCDTRAVKAFTRQAYEHGLVLITCPGCKSMHLIADHLGWFGESGFKIDEHLASQGQQVKRINMAQLEDNSAQITAEDMAGWSKVQQLLSTVAGAAADNTQSSSEGCCGGSGHKHDSTGAADPSQQRTGSTEAAATASDASNGSSESSEASDSISSSVGGPPGGVNSSMLQEAHSGVVEVAPSDVEAWVRVQHQKEQGKGRT